MALTHSELDRCQAEKVTLRHPKTGDTPYVIVGKGMMKFDGTWSHCFTYMNVKTKQSYTREVDDFKKFTAPKLKP